jgi:hypothetical protein
LIVVICCQKFEDPAMMMSHIPLVVFASILQGTPTAKPDGEALSSGQQASIKKPPARKPDRRGCYLE